MGVQKQKRIKWLLDTILPGYLVDTPTLKRHGVTRMLAHKYIASGWLEPVVRGLYRRPAAADTDPLLIVRSLQHVMNYPSVLGGRTALELQGFTHYVPMQDTQLIHLYGNHHPGWLKRINDAERFLLHSGRLFEDNSAKYTVEVQTPVGTLLCSTPERAVLELLDQLPARESVHIVDTMFEAFATARPRQLQKLLASCTSIKVKRLFFVFADKHAHTWRRHLSAEQFDLGSGPRALFEHGRFHPRYAIAVPPELMPDTQDSHD